MAQADFGGRLFPVAVNRLLVGLAFGQLTVVGLLGAKGNPIQSALVLPLPLVTAAFYAFLRERFYPAAYNLPRDADADEDGDQSRAAVAPSDGAHTGSPGAAKFPEAAAVYRPPHELVAAAGDFAVHQEEVESAAEVARRRAAVEVSVLQLLESVDAVPLPLASPDAATAAVLPSTPRQPDCSEDGEGDASEPLLAGRGADGQA